MTSQWDQMPLVVDFVDQRNGVEHFSLMESYADQSHEDRIADLEHELNRYTRHARRIRPTLHQDEYEQPYKVTGYSSDDSNDVGVWKQNYWESGNGEYGGGSRCGTLEELIPGAVLNQDTGVITE